MECKELSRGVHEIVLEAGKQALHPEAPVAVGLIFAGMVIVLRAAHAGFLALGTTAAVCFVQSTTKVSTYGIVGAVAGSYLLLFALLHYMA